MRVLCIEDDRNLASALSIAFEARQILVTCATNTDDGLHFASHFEFDLILLEWMMPDMHGAQFLQKLRTKGITTPLIVLGHALSSEERCLPFELGADDCVEKPFHFEELIARVNAIVRRARGSDRGALTFGSLTVDTDLKLVSVAGHRVHLTVKEYQTLECLALRRGRVVTKEILLSYLYGGMDEPGLKIIDVFICKIRRKLMPLSGGLDFIETTWGRGFTLRVPGAAEIGLKDAVA